MKELFSGIGDFKDRITLDIDKKVIPLKVFKELIKMRNVVGYKVKRSSGKGWHIIIYFSKVKSKRIVQYWRNALDDKLRIHYDNKEKPTNILFWKKRKIKK